VADVTGAAARVDGGASSPGDLPGTTIKAPAAMQ